MVLVICIQIVYIYTDNRCLRQLVRKVAARVSEPDGLQNEGYTSAHVSHRDGF